MIYCHECGSEVAETSEFCPYCGITLQKPQSEPQHEMPSPVEETDDEFSHTIVMSEPEIRDISAASEEFTDKAPSADAEPPVELAPAIDDSTPHFEEPTAPAGDDGDGEDQFDIPTPHVISELEQNLNQTSETPGARDSGVIPETSGSIALTQDIQPGEIDLPDLETPSVITESPMEEAAPNPLTDPAEATFEGGSRPAYYDAETSSAIAEPVEKNVEDTTSESYAFSADSENVGSDDTSQIESAASLPSEAPISSDRAEGEPNDSFEISEQNESVEPVEVNETAGCEAGEWPAEQEEGAELSSDADPETDPRSVPESGNTSDDSTVDPMEISMPEVDLPAEELFSNSTFDSVRIVEQDDHRPDLPKQDRLITPVEDRAAEPLSPSPSLSGTSEIESTGSDSKKAAKLKPLAEGVVLMNRYEIIRKIGGGGMGAVYLASDNNLGGVLRAVKEMVQAHIEEEQQAKAIEDFKRESMILSSLDHVSIPTIFDYFYDDEESRFYLVMKYISGGDLSSRLRSAPEGKIDEKTVTDWAIQIIDVLDYLHSQPSVIVYRDLKPSNVMLDGNNSRVMLIDFGIARSINQKDEKGVTAVGTMGYAPPELFSGKVEPRSDIYSLGSTMFHLLTGADPQSNPLLIFDFQKNPRPRQINPQLSDQMETILMRSVEYSADARFPTAADLRSVLEEHSKNLAAGRVTYGVSEAPEAVSLANQTVFCGFCGQNIVATDLFCAFCGAKQPIAQHGVHSEIYAQESTSARLVIVGTADLQATGFSLVKTENLVGRRDPMSNIFPEVDLSKFDPQTKISRRHAKIWHDGNKYFVEDLGSSNGTLLAANSGDSFRLPPHNPHRLNSGDIIRVGDTNLQFVVG